MLFEVLTAVTMKNTIIWSVTPCSLVDVYRGFRGRCCLLGLVFDLEDVKSTFLRNVGKMPEYITSRPKWHYSLRPSECVYDWWVDMVKAEETFGSFLKSFGWIRHGSSMDRPSLSECKAKPRPADVATHLFRWARFEHARIAFHCSKLARFSTLQTLHRHH
jgi:hypothetical protein